MSPTSPREVLTVDGLEVAISNPGTVLFPEAGHTKPDLAQYYVAVAAGALRAAGGRPNVLVRYPDGIHGEFFYQKRAPASRPDWIRVVALRFPSGRMAEEVVPRNAAALVWMANLACLELHPHPVRAEDLDHPDELRVDLDPVPGVGWAQVREVAQGVHATLRDLGLTGWPKTSGSRGLHVYVRIAPRWTFTEVRRAALALAREVERRLPALATSKWWKEERHGVFLDYNQNAKDRTIAAAYSVRPAVDARVSAPLTWDEVPDCDPGDFTMQTMPVRFRERGDVHAAMEDHVCSLEGLLELSAPPRARRSRRRALAAPVPEAARRAAARPAIPAAAAEAPARRGRTRGAKGRCARRARAVEAASSRRGGSPPARRRARRCDARPAQHLNPPVPPSCGPKDTTSSRVGCDAARRGGQADWALLQGSQGAEKAPDPAYRAAGGRGVARAATPSTCCHRRSPSVPVRVAGRPKPIWA